jgi:hypothetical protein
MPTTTDQPAPRPEQAERLLKRRSFRIELFVRRSLPRDKAEQLADRLAARDADHDDRRMCIECKHLQSSGGCFQSRQRPIYKRPPVGATPKVEWFNPAWPGGSTRDMQPVPTILQRCHLFEFRVPG